MIDQPKIVNDFAHIEQDSVNKVIVPITEEALIKGDAWLAQYESYYLAIGANCVDFVQDFYNILGGEGNFTRLFKHFNSNVLSERYAKRNYGVNKIVTSASATIEDIAKQSGYSIQNIKDCGKYLDYEDELFVEKRVFKIKRNFKKK